MFVRYVRNLLRPLRPSEGDEDAGVEGGEENGDEGVQIDMGAGDAPDGAVGEGPAAGQQTSAKRAA